MDVNVNIDIKLEQTLNDLLVECNLIGKNMVDKANQQLQSEIMNPDDSETKSIICRAHTEAIGNVKLACRRYLTTGRVSDTNTLERLYDSVTFYQKRVKKIISGTTQWVNVFIYDGEEVYKYGDTVKKVSDDTIIAGVSASELTTQANGGVATITYATVPLNLLIPNWDTAVTDALKNHIHKYIVDYVMWRFLQNQADDKCAEYKKLADEEDYPNIENDLTCRDRFIRRQAAFY